MIKSKDGVEIIIRDLELNPSCQHGPTILFSLRNGKKYFSCAGLRSHECFYLDYESFEQEKLNEFFQSTQKKSQEAGLRYADVLKLSSAQRVYCKTCEILAKSETRFESLHKSHNILKGIKDEFLKEPSLFLPQLDNDKLNAQYFFDDNSLEFIASILENLDISKIVCIGAPRLYDFIRSRKPRFKSILLDIDNRFQAFNQPDNFIHYNMFNNHYFNGPDDESKLGKFLKDEQSHKSQHCLFIDPPFAGRTELLTITFQTLAKFFNRVNSHHKLLPIFWVFPYFNEHHVQKGMPEMEMLDFQVTYMNHQAYHEGYKGRKAGSPVRLFTNVDPCLIKYPPSFTNYRFCSSCRRFVSVSNLHCEICKTCPSKNGTTYRHCPECIICVKPNYVHCSTCNRCVPKINHDCKTYQIHQECWFCSQRGHVEKNCSFARKLKRRKDGTCIVCKGRKKHHLKKCSSKQKFMNL